MENKYKNPYADDTMYGNVVSLVENLNLKNDGVHLDIACVFSAIDEGLKKHNYNFEYIGIDVNEHSINFLKQNDFEVYQYHFTCEEQDFDFIDKILNGRDLRIVTVLGFLEHVPNPETLLKVLYSICKKHNAVLVVSVPNVCHRDIVFKMMEGEFNYTETGLLDKTHLSLFFEKRLTNCMNDIGFQEVARNDFSMELSDQHFPADSTFLSSSTTVYQYFNHIKQLVDPFATVNQFVRAYVPLEKNHEKVEQSVASRPFLSIITKDSR